jgi:hypothetical protein
MLHYAEKQVEINKTLERAFTTVIKSQDLKGKDKDLENSLHHNTIQYTDREFQFFLHCF